MLWKRRECFFGGNDTRVPLGAALDLIEQLGGSSTTSGCVVKR